MTVDKSRHVEPGSEAPWFELYDPRWEVTVTRDNVKGTSGLLVMLICNHCPYSQLVSEELVEIGRHYPKPRIGIVAISSNDITAFPEDGPAYMAAEAKRCDYPFPYVWDETQQTAKSYRAACTPDFYLYNANLRLAYHGQLDGSRPGNGVPVTGTDLRVGLDAVLSSNQVPEPWRPSMGCSIKWKTGNKTGW
jgi:hypothetical protein